MYRNSKGCSCYYPPSQSIAFYYFFFLLFFKKHSERRVTISDDSTILPFGFVLLSHSPRRMTPIVLFGDTFPFTLIVFAIRGEPVSNSKEVFTYRQVKVSVGLTFQSCYSRLAPTTVELPQLSGGSPGWVEMQNIMGFFDSPGIWRCLHLVQ